MDFSAATLVRAVEVIRHGREMLEPRIPSLRRPLSQRTRARDLRRYNTPRVPSSPKRNASPPSSSRVRPATRADFSMQFVAEIEHVEAPRASRATFSHPTKAGHARFANACARTGGSRMVAVLSTLRISVRDLYLSRLCFLLKGRHGGHVLMTRGVRGGQAGV